MGPWRCRDPPTACMGGAHAGADRCLEEAVIQLKTRWREKALAFRLEQPVLGGLHPVERETRAAAVLGGLSVGETHVAADVVGLLLVRVDPRWRSSWRTVSRGKDPMVSQEDSSPGGVEENLGGELTKKTPWPVSLHC
ncbi:hypothetical protein HGM15179_019011 [Zosterops borbonicus]|uniref:Uncharacterized protein n=1 Tax=Zosterops borbonicus TaxID=364589 RepID=A0A8K1FVI4_9PASS|nr:hypothetical protein HGM15179_019011 [Zosterops borbonicus]